MGEAFQIMTDNEARKAAVILAERTLELLDKSLVHLTATQKAMVELTLLNKLGLPAETLGDSNGQFKELSDLA